jgi:hypothetical protein
LLSFSFLWFYRVSVAKIVKVAQVYAVFVYFLMLFSA